MKALFFALVLVFLLAPTASMESDGMVAIPTCIDPPGAGMWKPNPRMLMPCEVPAASKDLPAWTWVDNKCGATKLPVSIYMDDAGTLAYYNCGSIKQYNAYTAQYSAIWNHPNDAQSCPAGSKFCDGWGAA